MNERHAFALLTRQYIWDKKIGAQALAKRIGFLPGAKSEDPGKAFYDLWNSGTTIHYPQLKQLFWQQAVTTEYLGQDLPVHVEVLLREAYPEETQGSEDSGIGEYRFGSGPSRVLPRSSDFSPEAIGRLRIRYSGIWHVVRYAHTGDRIVRCALAILEPDPTKFGHPFPHFEIYFRTSMLIDADKHLPEAEQEFYHTEGSVSPMRGGKYMLFSGIENTGYPLFIMAPIASSNGKVRGRHAQDPDLRHRTSHNLPVDRFFGIVSRHHNDAGLFFSTPAAFIRSRKYTKMADYPLSKIRTWPEAEGIAENREEHLDIEATLARLRSFWPKDGRGSLQALVT